MSGALTNISMIDSLFNPVIGVGMASAGLVIKGALRDSGKIMLTWGEFYTQKNRAPSTVYAPPPPPFGAPTVALHDSARGGQPARERVVILFLVSMLNNP